MVLRTERVQCSAVCRTSLVIGRVIGDISVTRAVRRGTGSRYVVLVVLTCSRVSFYLRDVRRSNFHIVRLYTG